MTWKRVATAAVLIPLVVGLVLWTTTAIVALGLALVVMLAMFEYFALGEAIGHRAYRFWTASCALVLIYVQWLATTWPSDYLTEWELRYRHLFGFIGGAPTIPGALFLFVLGITTLTLWTKRPLVEALPAAGISSSALLLVAFPLSYTVRLHAIPMQGPRVLLFALVLTWAGDTAAYFVGRAIGNHPLAPHLSPKKTWEGSIASLGASLAVGLGFSRWISVALPHVLIMAGLANVAGQVGDLLESAYKRSAGIKDSGSILPGHGGVLDRIDALILAIPVVWYYWILIYPPR